MKVPKILIFIQKAGFLNPLRRAGGTSAYRKAKVYDMKKSLFICLITAIWLLAQGDKSLVKPSVAERFFEAAKRYVGVPFVWGGRSKDELDCLGLLFLAYTEVTGKRWQGLSVLPSKLVKSGELGKPVEDIDGILREKIDYTQLKKGDIIYFLVTEKIYDTDVPLLEIDGIPYWVWHVGIYAGFDKKPMVLHACPSDHVKIEPLEGIYFEAIFVTRLVEADANQKQER